MTKGIRVEVFVENAPGFVLCLPAQKLTRKQVRDELLEFLEDDYVSRSRNKDAYAAVLKSKFTFKTTPITDEEPREFKQRESDPPQ